MCFLAFIKVVLFIFLPSPPLWVPTSLAKTDIQRLGLTTQRSRLVTIRAPSTSQPEENNAIKTAKGSGRISYTRERARAAHLKHPRQQMEEQH